MSMKRRRIAASRRCGKLVPTVVESTVRSSSSVKTFGGFSSTFGGSHLGHRGRLELFFLGEPIEEVSER